MDKIKSNPEKINKEIKKPSEYRDGDKFSDGNVLKKKFFFDDKINYIIYLNKNNEVKYRIGPENENCLSKIRDLSMVAGEILLLSIFLKKDLNLKLAYIYKLAILNQKEEAERDLEALKKSIFSRKKMLKQFVYLLTPVILSIVFYLLSTILYIIPLDSLKIIYKYKTVFLFVGMGSFLSISKNIKNIEFETTEMIKSYFIFAFFKYLHSLFSGTLLIFLCNGNIVNIRIEGASQEAFVRTLAVIGSFSESLVPNIFDNLGKNIKATSDRSEE